MRNYYNIFYDYEEERTINGETYVKGVCSRLRHYLPWVEPGEKKALQKADGSYLIDIPAYTGSTDFGSMTQEEANDFDKYAQDMIQNVCDSLVNHPNTAPFVCKHLIIHSTTANPSPEYVARVALVFRNDGNGNVGNMAEVWKAIFLDPEVTSPSMSRTTYGRPRDGYELLSNIVRSFDYRSIDAPTSPRIVPLSDTNNLGFQDFVPQTIYEIGTTTEAEWRSCGVPDDKPIEVGTEFYPKEPFPVITTTGQVKHRDDEQDVYWDKSLTNRIHTVYTFTSIWAGYNSRIGTYPLQNPSIFGFYGPDYTLSPADGYGLNVPAVGSMSGPLMMDTTRLLRYYTTSLMPLTGSAGNQGTGRINDFDNSLGDTIFDSDPTDMIQRINLLLCGGKLTEAKKQIIFDLVNPLEVDTDLGRCRRASICCQLVVRASEFYVGH